MMQEASYSCRLPDGLLEVPVRTSSLPEFVITFHRELDVHAMTMSIMISWIEDRNLLFESYRYRSSAVQADISFPVE